MCVCVCVCVCVQLLSHVWLFAAMDCSLSASSTHGISQAKILEWVAISSSRGSSQPRHQTHAHVSPVLAGRLFFTTTTWNALYVFLHKACHSLPAFRSTKHHFTTLEGATETKSPTVSTTFWKTWTLVYRVKVVTRRQSAALFNFSWEPGYDEAGRTSLPNR